MKHAKSRIASLLAMVLVVCMLLTLVGCGDDKKSDDGKGKKTTTTTITTTTTTTTNGEGGDPTDPTEGGEDGTTTATDDPFGTTTSATLIGGGEYPTATYPSMKDASTLLDQVPEKLSKQKLRMLIWWDEQTDDTKEAETFQKETGIKVKYEKAVMNEYTTELSQQILAQNPPQIAAIINEWYPAPITNGLMQPIKNTGWDYTEDIYATKLMDQFSYKGEHYGIALKGSNAPTYIVMFFNKQVLKDNGVSKDPWQLWKEGNWNWDSCLEIAKKCTDTKEKKYGMTLISQYFWMLSMGTDFVTSDINGLKNNIRSSQVLKGWEYAWDMYNTEGVIIPEFDKQQRFFFNGSVAMLGVGSFMMQADKAFDYVPQNCNFDWGVVPFPSPKGQSPVAACEGTVWGFPETVKGDALQAAMWFVRYYLDDANYGRKDFYANAESWEVMKWMSSQQVQSYNSVGVVAYNNANTAWTIQQQVFDGSTSKAAVKTNLNEWYAVLDQQIDDIVHALD